MSRISVPVIVRIVLFVPLLVLGPAGLARASRAPPARSSPVVHDPARAPASWFAISDHALWVCWRAPDPGTGGERACWTRIAAAPAVRGNDDGATRARGLPAPRSVRAGFLDPATLVLGVGDGTRWVVTRGDSRARALLEPDAEDEDDNGARGRAPAGARGLVLARPTPVTCSPSGQIPTRRGGVWIWRIAACERRPGRTCAGRRAPSVRRSAGLRASLAVEFTAERGLTRAVIDGRTRARQGASVVLLAGFGFDPRARARAGRARRALLLQTASRAVQLPPLRARALALARRERAALAAILCDSGSARR